MKNPAGAAAIMQRVSQYPPSFLHLSVPYTLRLLAQNNGMRTGCLSARAWQAFGNWMKSHRLLHDAPKATAVMTDNYLPYPSC